LDVDEVADGPNNIMGILGDIAGLALLLFLDRTVSGTTRGDGEAEFIEEHAHDEVVVSLFTLVPILSVSSLPMG